MRLSGRVDWHRGRNAIARAVETRRSRKLPLVDLTVSNPTTVGLETPPGISDALRDGSRVPYRPDPRGSILAREALARWLGERGAEGVDPGELFLTSSTSEAYSWILKILCDPGDGVLRFTPTYPLLDHLCGLESVGIESVPLDGALERWSLHDDQTLRSAVARSRAAIVVHPNNPTGHLWNAGEVGVLSKLLDGSGGALIADEVFFEYATGAARRIASDADCLTFSLGGLSKSAALPHWKLGWVRVTGPEELRDEAIEALELVADTYLPVATPVQHALPAILDHADRMIAEIVDRVRKNLEAIDRITAELPAIRRAPFEGGWSAVLRVPSFDGEEALVLDLIEGGVLVHPGYFYDFTTEGWIVASLLPRTEEMEKGIGLVHQYFADRC